MGKVLARIASYFVFILFLLAGEVAGRHLHFDAAESVSDGITDGGAREEESFLHIKEMDSSEKHCEQMYGFLPCSSNVPGHIFLILIYEFLLYHGESFAGGDGRIFRVLGKSIYTTTFSQLIDALPESLILLATGLSSSKEKAENYVVTSIGLLAGSSIMLITLLWGVCFICARKKFHVKQDHIEKNQVIELLTGSGVVTDVETSFHANIIFFSLIPFVVIISASLFGLSNLSEEYNIVLLVSLPVSVICLIIYFIYQRFDLRIMERRQEYAEVEQKIEMHVHFYDVHALMLEREKHLMTKRKEMEELLKPPQPNEGQTLSSENFYPMFVKKFDELMDDPYSMDQRGTKYNQVAEMLLEEKIKVIEIIYAMMEHALKELQKDKLQIEDDEGGASIDRLFNHIDTDKDGVITRLELKDYIMDMHYKEILLDDKIIEIMMRNLDINESGDIDQKEFKSGVTKLLRDKDKIDSRTQKKQSHDGNHDTDMYHQGEAKAKNVERFLAVALLILGIAMLFVLAEPLVESVQKFSESINIDPFYVSFILVPLATNLRKAIAAIRAAKQKNNQTTSLTFSEIYHKVFMNNIFGFIVLASVVSVRGFTWHFSDEIIVVVGVCIVMGIITSCMSKYPAWILFIVFLLYPLSIFLVYLVSDSPSFT